MIDAIANKHKTVDSHETQILNLIRLRWRSLSLLLLFHIFSILYSSHVSSLLAHAASFVLSLEHTFIPISTQSRDTIHSNTSICILYIMCRYYIPTYLCILINLYKHSQKTHYFVSNIQHIISHHR